METGTAQFIDYLMTVPNLLIVSSVWILQGSVAKAFPSVRDHHLYARIAPVLPIVMASIFVWVPGAVVADVSIASRVFLGITLGFLSAHGHKLFRQTALGQDQRIQLRE